MKKNRIIAIFVILAMLTFSFTSAAVVNQNNTYTALGDSIAVGVGGNNYGINDTYGYVDRLIAWDFADWDNRDLSSNGLTSAELLSNLTDPTNPAYSVTRDGVTYADVITVSIGGNDLLQVLLPLYNDNPDFLSSLSFWQRHFISMQLVHNAKNFGPNWKNIIKNIRLLNADADVYVNTLYNPFSTCDPLFYFADPFIRTINASIRVYANTYCYEVVDVYTAFRGNDELVHGMDNPGALHPTNDGYDLIYSLIKTLMNVPV